MRRFPRVRVEADVRHSIVLQEIEQCRVEGSGIAYWSVMIDIRNDRQEASRNAAYHLFANQRPHGIGIRSHHD